MAELTIEQKAERYDEAIKRAKAKIKNDKDHVLYEDDVLEIFPELAESKGARIIKVIRGWILTRPALFFDNGISKEEILSWLDKQSEKEKFIEKELGNIRGYREEALRRLQELEKQGKHDTSWSEADEQKLQKVIDFMKHPDLAKSTPTLAKTAITWLESIKDKVRPQQEWSSEDKENSSMLIDFIESKEQSTEVKIALIDWLKSIEHRILSNPVKLSDENEAVLDALIRRLEGEDIYVSPHLAVDCLKSIKAISYRKNQWKPSAEQMKALEAMLTVSPQSPAITSALIELYQDLKKLK